MTQDHTTAAPTCYRHPDRHTLLRCSHCDRPICGACSIDAAVGQRCPECVKGEGAQKVIPTGPRRRSRAGGAPATKTFVALAVAFFLMTGFGSTDTWAVQNLSQWNLAVAEGQWWRIFTPVLLHGSPTHILFNMWALWILGPQIERGVGTGPFVGLYLATAGMGGVFAFYMGDLNDVAVGASGAIFGLFGVWLNWAYQRRGTVRGQAMLRQIGFLLLINAAIPFLVPSIAWEAHLGGLIAGFVIGEIWSRLRGENLERKRTLVASAVVLLAIVLVLI